MALTNPTSIAWGSANNIMLNKTTLSKCQLQYDGYIKINVYSLYSRKVISFNKSAQIKIKIFKY